MKLRILASACVLSLTEAGLPAHAESFGEGLSSWSAPSWSWEHILFVSLAAVGFGLVFGALGLLTIRQVRREVKTKTRADPLYRPIRHGLKRRAARRECDHQKMSTGRTVRAER
jgi:hypothetical protein